MANIESRFSGLGEFPSEIPSNAIPEAFREAVAAADGIRTDGSELVTRFRIVEDDEVDLLTDDVATDDIDRIEPHEERPGFFRVHIKETVGLAAITVAGSGIIAARAYLRSRPKKQN